MILTRLFEQITEASLRLPASSTALMQAEILRVLGPPAKSEVSGVHYGPKWCWDQNRPEAIQARAQMEESYRILRAAQRSAAHMDETGAPELTPEMIEAGCYELAHFNSREDDDETAVVLIYKAMEGARRTNP